MKTCKFCVASLQAIYVLNKQLGQRNLVIDMADICNEFFDE